MRCNLKIVNYGRGGYDPLTNAYISRMQTKPNAAFIKVIDRYFTKNSKVVNGNTITTKQILAKRDVVYLGNINDSNDSFINFVKNAHHGTKQGSGLVWDDKWGYSNPNGTGWVDTHFNPSTQGVTYTQNDAGHSVYTFNKNLSTVSGNWIYGAMSGQDSYMGLRDYLTFFRSYTNSSTPAFVSPTPFLNGLTRSKRITSSSTIISNQNIPTTTISSTSYARPNANVHLFRLNGASGYYLGGLNVFSVGAALTDDEKTAWNLIINEYLKECLYLKFGATNWGVQMAKSYFDTLHNFEPYEAWEVYEFIKRHQGDHPINIIPLPSSNFDTDGTGWWEAAYWTSKSWNASGYMSLVASNTNSLYVRRNGIFGVEIGKTYRVRFKYKSPNCTKKLLVYLNGTYIGAAETNAMTTSWQQYDANIVAVTNSIYISISVPATGDQCDLDDIIVDDIRFTTGYLYNTFGPGSATPKTVADYIMLFKAGGNLGAMTITKTGAVPRWNLDGSIVTNASSGAFARGTGLGVITATSTDGFNLMTTLTCNQTSSSVNSLYGNFPLIEKIKTTDYSLSGYGNRFKINLLNNTLLRYNLDLTPISYPGYYKVNLNNFVGKLINNYFYLYNSAGASIVQGDMSLWTNEYQSSREFRIEAPSDSLRFDNLNGTLQNFVINNLTTSITIINSGITAGFSTWNVNMAAFNISKARFTTQSILDLLSIQKNQFTATPPIKNLTENFSGATMGIVPSNHQLILDIAAQHVAVGKTFTCTTITS